MPGPKSPTPSHERVALYHYAVKSVDDFQQKMARGSGMGNVKTLDFLRYVDNFTAAAAELQRTNGHRYTPKFKQLIVYSLCLRDYGIKHRFLCAWLMVLLCCTLLCGVCGVCGVNWGGSAGPCRPPLQPSRLPSHHLTPPCFRHLTPPCRSLHRL